MANNEQIPFESSDEEPYINQINKLRIDEFHAFNWRCILCNIVAVSSLSLQMKSEDDHGPIADFDDKLWIKCSKCCSAFHLSCLCLTRETVIIPYLCPIFGCSSGTAQDPANSV